MKFNRHVEKKMKIYNKVKMLETYTDRKYFTKHGKHLNISCKEQISMKLITVIKEFFTKKGKILSLKDSNPDHQKQKKG
jgi:hypothetical protein